MSLLRENAVLALFVCLALGYLIGKLRVGPIQLGGICGTLIISMLIGARHVSVDADVKNVAFALFIFSLGYLAGPQFFANLNAKGLRFGVLSLLEAVMVIGMAIGIAKVGNLDTGTASGILAGSATESAVVGTAQESIAQLPGITTAQSTALQAHVATAYSVCYLFGLISIVLLTSQFFPMLMRINLAQASRELWEKMLGAVGGKELAPHETTALPALVGRTYQVRAAAGSTIGELEAMVGEGASVEGVKRGAKLLTIAANLLLREGDLALVVGERESVILLGKALGPESPSVPGLESALLTRQVVVTQKNIAGQQCSTPAITAVGNVANSSVPMLGYTITYTLSNFLLPLTGPILVGVIGLRT